jgi:hypothetical protein
MSEFVAIVGVMASGFFAIIAYLIRLESRISRLEGKIIALLGDPNGGDKSGAAEDKEK